MRSMAQADLPGQALKAFYTRVRYLDLRARYGQPPSGRVAHACSPAYRVRRARLVTVNMFDNVFNEITWTAGRRRLAGSHRLGGLQGHALSDVPDTAHSSCWTTTNSAVCSTTRWSWRWASSAGRRNSTLAAGATTGRACGPFSAMPGQGWAGYWASRQDRQRAQGPADQSSRAAFGVPWPGYYIDARLLGTLRIGRCPSSVPTQPTSFRFWS